MADNYQAIGDKDMDDSYVYDRYDTGKYCSIKPLQLQPLFARF